MEFAQIGSSSSANLFQCITPKRELSENMKLKWLTGVDYVPSDCISWPFCMCYLIYMYLSLWSFQAGTSFWSIAKWHRLHSYHLRKKRIQRYAADFLFHTISLWEFFYFNLNVSLNRNSTLFQTRRDIILNV